MRRHSDYQGLLIAFCFVLVSRFYVPFVLGFAIGNPITDGNSNLTTTPGAANLTTMSEPFRKLITARLEELHRLYAPDSVRLSKITAVSHPSSSTNPADFNYIRLVFWLPRRRIWGTTENDITEPTEWGPVSEQSAGRKAPAPPTQALWDWEEREPKSLTEAFALLTNAGVLKPTSRIRIEKYTRHISWGPQGQPYWLFEGEGYAPIHMGAHDQIIYRVSEQEMTALDQEQELDQEQSLTGGGDGGIESSNSSTSVSVSVSVSGTARPAIAIASEVATS